MRAAIDYGEAKCQSLSGTVLETFVVERLLQVVAMASLEMSLSAVDPENRLVARELERRWDESLRAHEQLQADYSRFQRECPTRLSDTEREQILALAEDLPTFWQADSTTPEDRQTVARMLLDQVIVSIEGDTDRVDVELCWASGFTSRHAPYRPVQTYEQLSNYEQLVERIDALRAEGKSLASTANVLNVEGFHPPKRASQFTAAMLSRLLRERGVRSGPLPRSVSEGRHLQPHEWWLADLAAELQMPVATMHRWQRVGWVTSRKVAVAQGRWAIFVDADELARLRLLRAARRGWADEPYPRDLITPKPKTG
jgi:hypothetical protein